MQINLLSPQTLVKNKPGLEKSTRMIILTGGALTILLLVSAGLLGMVKLQVNSSIKTAEAELARLQPVAQQMGERNRLNQELATKQSLLAALEKSRPMWTPHILEIKQNLPVTVGLTSISFDNSKGEWEISGTSPNHDQVAQFGTGLQGLEYFGKGLIASSTINQVGGGLKFTIKAVTSGGSQK